MSTNYSARVFFGTYAKRATRAFEVLEKVIDDNGGTPAPVEKVAGAEVNFVGACMTGEVCNTIEHKGVGATFDQYGEAPYSPVELLDNITHVQIFKAMKALGIASSEVAPIGWYFCGIAI